MRRFVAPLLLVALAVAIAGCAPAAGGWLALVLALALAVAGCAESHGVRPDGDVPPPDGFAGDAGGVWERCCEDGILRSCFCPAGWACNYGMGLVVCSDGMRCGHSLGGWPTDPVEVARVCGEDAGIDVIDAGPPDAGGDWEPCCDDTTGTISSCFCPAGVECNYGWYTTCADGSCSSDPSCPRVDAGPPDAG